MIQIICIRDIKVEIEGEFSKVSRICLKVMYSGEKYRAPKSYCSCSSESTV